MIRQAIFTQDLYAQDSKQMSKRSKAAQESSAVDQQSEYATELKRVYNEIDMFSNLRWHERDADELYWKQGKRTSARIR